MPYFKGLTYFFTQNSPVGVKLVVRSADKNHQKTPKLSTKATENMLGN